MKQANNNEVDLLLRSFARGQDKSRSKHGLDSGDGTATISEHMDADELSSYAEGVVPAPALTRYMEHLADCDACRGIVINLTQAAGVAGRYEVQQQERGSTFWQSLTALFSPAVLRFAVPALVLTAAIGIAGLAFWQQRQDDLLARNQQAPAPTSKSEPAADRLTLSPAADATPAALPSGVQSATNSQAQRKESDLQNEKAGAAETVVTGEPTMAKAPALKDSGQPAELTAAPATRPYVAEPKPEAAPPPPLDLGRVAKSADNGREATEKRDDQPRSRDSFRVQSDGEHGPNRARNNTPPAANQRAASGVMGGRGPSADKNKKVGEDKVDEDEIRTVAGRRFVRQGSSWVDTAYDTSRATIKVTRGSDQFRALVADEPEIRAIANQLSGVVIVLWKNRAYRIQ